MYLRVDVRLYKYLLSYDCEKKSMISSVEKNQKKPPEKKNAQSCEKLI